ncbi:MAG: SprT-like domain-containing protein [Bacteroidaceae bacterium]|nr:SprT-like domain-containing protein [Bacteroidaceae bacterium]
MVANIDNIASTFMTFNEAYFGGVLPWPLFGVLHSYRTCGVFEYRARTWDGDLVDPIIKVTDYYDMDEEVFNGILCHEMIHYYLMYLHFKDRSMHGKWFKKKVKQLNEKYGLNIPTFIDITDLKRRKGAPLLGYWLRHFYIMP